MRDLFKAELFRFRYWALAYFLVHGGLIAFYGRVTDLLQQPLMVVQGVAAVYALSGVLLGLYQMGGYRRPNRWLNLIHRPLDPRRIALALIGAAAALMLVALVLPMAILLSVQELFSARVVDLRHWLIPVAGFLIAFASYLAGAYAMLGVRRYAPFVLILPALLAFSEAVGLGAIAVQLLVALWLGLLVLTAFRPDLTQVPSRPVELAATALPVAMAVYLMLLAIGGIAFQLGWIMLGTHPLNSIPQKGGFVEASRSEGPELVAAGLAGRADPQATLWREQIRISDAFRIQPGFDVLPVRGELTNSVGTEFDDNERGIHWTFSHDSMRFEGRRAVGGAYYKSLGLGDGSGRFQRPPVSLGDGTMVDAGRVARFDQESEKIEPRIAVPAGETIAAPPAPVGESVALLTDKALYFYDAQVLESGDREFPARQRVALAGPIGNLERIDLVETLDGYLVSEMFGRGNPDGLGDPWQQLVRVDGGGRAGGGGGRRPPRPGLGLSDAFPLPRSVALTGLALRLSGIDRAVRAANAAAGQPAVGRSGLRLGPGARAQPGRSRRRLVVGRTGGAEARSADRLDDRLGPGGAAGPGHPHPLPSPSIARKAGHRLFATGNAPTGNRRSGGLSRPSPPLSTGTIMQTIRNGLKLSLCLFLLAAAMSSRAAAPAGEGSLSAAIAAERSRPAAPLLPRAAFLARSNLVDVKLSPRGSHVAFLRRQAGGQSLWLRDTAGGAPHRLLRHSEAGRLFWSADGKWLFLDSPRQLFALPLRPAPGAGLMTLLGGKSGRHLLGGDPSVPAAMLVIEDVRAPGALRPSGWRLLRMAPGRPARVLFRSRREIAAYIPGTRGGDSFVKIVEGDHMAIRRIGRDGVAREALRCVRLEQCQPLSSPAPGELLLSADVGGDLERLLRLDRTGTLHLVHQDPAGTADLAEASVDPADGRPLFAAYRSISAQTFALAPDMAPHAAVIERALGPGFHVSVGRGPNARWLVAESGDRLQQPAWYLYDPATTRLTEILAEVEAKQRRVPAEAAARRIPVSWRGSDGFLLHGFVALPPGADPARVPLIVSVHGGPWSHVSAGWSAITQFLVNRGYAVFEPNFRGSTGYGRSYAFAAGADFGDGRVQRDIEEGTRFLLGEGIGDPARVGITGVSFGGYSSLMGVTFAPDLFRVAVAAMPPTDFGWVMRWQLGREQARGFAGLGLRNSLAAMAIDPSDPGTAARLAAQSPVANAARLRRPVLLIAGGRDESVPLRSVVDYAARLRALGRDVSLFVDPRSGHRIEEPATQEQYLYLMEHMLGANLGKRWGPPPAGEAGRSLGRNLRLAGTAHPLRGG